ALFFSFSRSAWLGLAGGLIVMMALAVVGKNLKQQRNLAEIILVMGILLFILFNQYQNLITSRLGGEGRLEEKSTSERLVSYQESWQMIKNNWAIGVGLGNYTLALNRQAPKQNSFYYQPAHNVFMLVLSEIGIVGLLFFIGLIFIIASNNLFCHSGRRAGIQFGCENRVSGLRVKPAMTRCLEFSDNENLAAILIALIVAMSLDHWTWSLHFGVLFFWLVLGLIISGKRNKIDAEKIV
ncbi:MAG: O-antigen ligase family protein, partial [Candidatus Gracilibacteria bacterium]